MTPMQKEHAEKFAAAMNSRVPFRFPWSAQARYVMNMKKAAADSRVPTDPRVNDDIVRGLLDVHQQQQQSVAAAENESRSLREEIDQAHQQLATITQNLQQTQGQLQQTQMQAQQQVQQAQMQAQTVQSQAGPAVQQAQMQAQQAAADATTAKMEAAQAKEMTERIRQATMDYKGKILDAVSMDPVTLAAAQDMQRQQQMASAMQAQNTQAAMQQAAAAEQGGQPQQGQQGQPQGQGGEQEPGGQSSNPLDQLSRLVAGQGERAGMRRAMATTSLQQGAQQGAQQGQGGIQVPQGSMAEAALKQGAFLESLDKQANALANDLRVRQGGQPRPSDGSTKLAALRLLGLQQG
jgi:hypothetical protein